MGVDDHGLSLSLAQFIQTIKTVFDMRKTLVWWLIRQPDSHQTSFFRMSNIAENICKN